MAKPEDNEKLKAALNMGQSFTTSTTQSGGGPAGGGAASGAMSGAAAGASFGPWGAAIGAVAGAVMGSAKAAAARKAHNAKVEATKIKAIGEIEERKSGNISKALGGIGLRASLR